MRRYVNTTRTKHNTFMTRMRQTMTSNDLGGLGRFYFDLDLNHGSIHSFFWFYDMVVLIRNFGLTLMFRFINKSLLPCCSATPHSSVKWRPAHNPPHCILVIYFRKMYTKFDYIDKGNFLQGAVKNHVKDII